MSLKDIVVGDFGNVVTLTILDVDTDEAADLSGYDDTQQMIFTDPSGTSTTKAAGWATDGTDGAITYTLEADFIDAAGTWVVRGRVIDTGNKQLTSTELEFVVLA